jgi:hypothetical protein
MLIEVADLWAGQLIILFFKQGKTLLDGSTLSTSVRNLRRWSMAFPTRAIEAVGEVEVVVDEEGESGNSLLLC